MSTLIHTFASLPESLKGMAIELALIRARQDQYGNLRSIVEEAVVAAAAAAELEVNIKPHAPNAAVGPAKPDSEETATQQVTAGGANPDYVDPEIYDPKEADDAMDALAYLFENILGLKRPEKHCGRSECKACNELFGDQQVKPETNKLRFVQVFHQDGVSGPVDIYQSRTNPKVYALMNKGRTAVIESDNITQMPYEVAVEIIRLHGKVDRSIVG